MIEWRRNLQSLTCSVASLMLSLLAIGLGIIATQNTPARPHGPQIFYLANGTDNPDRIKKNRLRGPENPLRHPAAAIIWPRIYYQTTTRAPGAMSAILGAVTIFRK
jgi:hypothetical protein